MNTRQILVVGLGTALLGLAGLSACATCVADPVLVDPCDGGECFRSYCAVDAGVSVCLPWKPLGAPCTRNAECSQLSCVEGTCVASDMRSECP